MSRLKILSRVGRVERVNQGVSGGGGGAAPSSLLTGLVAYWPLDEASGQRNDSHTNALHLTDNETVTQAAGKIGSAGQFVAANNESLSRADEALISFGAGSFTFSAWFYLDTKASFYTSIGKEGEFLVQFDGTTLRGYISANGSAYTNVDSLVDPATAAWHHIVFGWDGTNVFIQIDGGTLRTAAFAGPVFSGVEPLYLGRTTGGGFFNGRIDEVGLWSRDLTAPERERLYNGGAGVTYPAFA